jgi:hypothetical protein
LPLNIRSKFFAGSIAESAEAKDEAGLHEVRDGPDHENPHRSTGATAEPSK